MIKRFANWLCDHAPIYGWDKGYQTTNHVIWSWVILAITLLCAFFISPFDIAKPIQAICLTMTFGPFVQELIYMFIKRKNDKSYHYDISNVFSGVIGGVMGMLLSMFIWWIIR